MPCPFVFNKKKKKKKKRFSEVIHLFSKVGAFSYALSPLSGPSKNHSPLFQKKKKKMKRKETLSKNKWSFMHKVSKLGAFDPVSFR